MLPSTVHAAFHNPFDDGIYITWPPVKWNSCHRLGNNCHIIFRISFPTDQVFTAEE
jgi:hypothetical protein